ncbi:hypothetical protein Ndes2526B_g05397 [Nannochloris sp. 'desiccata']
MPGVITVLVGPPSCGKSRFLKEMVDQLGLGQDPPPVIFINSRLPVIVIDEANNLMDWTEPDYFLANWIKGKGVATNNFRIHVLGDLTEEEAREFVYGTAVGATIDPLSVAAPGVAAPVLM